MNAPNIIRLLGRPKDPEKAKIWAEAEKGIQAIDERVYDAKVAVERPLRRALDTVVLGPFDLLLDGRYESSGSFLGLFDREEYAPPVVTGRAAVALRFVREAADSLANIPRELVIEEIGRRAAARAKAHLASSKSAFKALRETVAEVTPVAIGDWKYSALYSTTVVVDPFTRMSIGLEILDRAEKALLSADGEAVKSTLDALRSELRREAEDADEDDGDDFPDDNDEGP